MSQWITFLINVNANYSMQSLVDAKNADLGFRFGGAQTRTPLDCQTLLKPKVYLLPFEASFS